MIFSSKILFGYQDLLKASDVDSLKANLDFKTFYLILAAAKKGGLLIGGVRY